MHCESCLGGSLPAGGPHRCQKCHQVATRPVSNFTTLIFSIPLFHSIPTPKKKPNPNPTSYKTDFTINSIAICLAKSHYGSISDYFNGVRDINERSLRIVQSLVFFYDIALVFRAVRYLIKFELVMGFTTERLLKAR